MDTKQSTTPTRRVPAHQHQAAARPQPSENTSSCTVTLTAFRPGFKIGVIKAICDITGLDPKIAKNIMKDLPATIDLHAVPAAEDAERMGWSAAVAVRELMEELAAAGATAQCTGAQPTRTSMPDRETLERNVRGESPSAEPTRFLDGNLFDKRLNAIRDRLWYAAGIVGCVIAAEREDETTDAGNALQLVRRELRAIADNELYAEELLAADEAQEVEHG